MEIARKIALVVIILLSLTAGVPKVLRMPQETQFFQDSGLGAWVVILIGLLQLAAGVLLVYQPSRKVGAVIATFCFGISAVMIFASGAPLFGLFSLIPVLLAAYLIRQAPPPTGEAP